MVDVEKIPLLNTVIVEGVLLFVSGKNIDFHARNILISKGHLIVGNEKNPLNTGTVIITMHGKNADP